MNKYRLMLSIFLGLAAFTAIFIWLTKDEPKTGPTVANFEECVKAGYPVMESYPRQCTAPSGKFFVEQVMQER